jgi:hypothetical protein
MYLLHIFPLTSTHLLLRCCTFFNWTKKNSFDCVANRKIGNRKSQNLISTVTCIYIYNYQSSLSGLNMELFIEVQNLFFFNLNGVESNWAHSALRPRIGLLCQPRMIMMMEKLVKWWFALETEVFGENLLQRHFIHHKPHMLCPDTNPDRRGGNPGTNRLSYGTA